MKISTWNVNSIRARIENIKKYLKSNSPDIILLQEIKTEEQNYPFDDLKELGYISYVNGQKSYNGVSILSKKKFKYSSLLMFVTKIIFLYFDETLDISSTTLLLLDKTLCK